MGVQADFRPWTSRPGVTLRGIRPQTATPNFVHELLDLRYLAFMKHRKMDPMVAEVPAELVTDLRQNVSHQKKDGSVTLLPRSLLYWHAIDRVAVGEEHIILQGWPDDFHTDGLGDGPSHGVMPDEQHPEKRRRIKKRMVGPICKELAGSAFSLPDACLILYAGLLAATNSGLFERPPAPIASTPTSAASDPRQVRLIVVDPDNTAELQQALASSEVMLNDDDECDSSNGE